MISLLKRDDVDLRGGLSLYFHLPFCQHKCFYCDFFSQTSTSSTQQTKIINQMMDDAQKALELLAITSIETLYIGGGSPSLAPIESVKKMIKLGCDLGAKEITIEANPEQLTANWLDAIWSSGATRLSVGIQTFNVESLKKVGRHVSLKSIEQALLLLEPYKAYLNIDLMAGLPGQTIKLLQNDIQRIIDFKPAHISFYSLTVEDGTALANMTNMLASDDEQALLWQTGKYLLNKAGYLDYEISNYSLIDKKCLHNRRYWDLQPYLGFGPSATGNIPLKDGSALRVVGIKNLEMWATEQKNLYTSEVISREDFMFEHFMMALRSSDGLDKSIFEQRFGNSQLAIYRNRIDKQWLIENSSRLALNEQGRLFLDQILQQLL